MNDSPRADAASWVYTVAKLLVIVIQIASAVFLGLGIYRIKQNASASDGTDQINVPQMFMHIMAFGLYLAALLVSLVFWLLFYILNVVGFETVTVSFDVCNWISFVAQLFLIGILWRLAKDDQFVEETSANDKESTGEPSTISFDPEKDENVRIWRQLVRRYRGSVASSDTASMAGLGTSSLLMN